MSRILIDLTDLELWSGHHGGTQRVAYGIAKNFYLDNDTIDQEVCFISFSSGQKAFYQTTFQPIYERVEALAEESSYVRPSAIGRRARLKRKLTPYVPEAIKRSPRARKVIKKSVVTSLQVVGKARATVGKMKISAPTRMQPVSFSSDDVVLILGKPWDDLNIQKTLSREKAIERFKLVQVVYDLIIPLNPQLHHPSLFKNYTQNMFEAVDASDLLLPISQSSLNDLKVFCKRLNLRLPKTKVIRLADQFSQVQSSMPDNRIADRFIACIGTMEIRKNHMLLYYSYKLAQQQSIELPQLVIVGSRGWLTGDLQYLIDKDPTLKDKIIILDNISDAGLSWIYQNCMFSVYPSMYEGWGLPVAESLAYGKLCVSSNVSSMPEIAGDLVDYFSPYDTAGCLAKIVEYSNLETLRARTAKLQAYKPTTWEQTTNQVQEAINKLIITEPER